MVRLDVKESRELLATIYALRSIDSTLAKQVRQHTKRVVEPEWRKELAERAHTKLQHRVIVDTAVVSVSNQNVRVQAASKGRKLRGGFNPKTDYAAAEFGAKKGKKTNYSRRSRKGTTHKVTRDTRAQLPQFRKGGYVFWPAAEEMTPRIASLYVQTTVRTIAEALEGKS